MKKLFKKFLRPKGALLVLTYVLTVVFITAAILMLFVEYEGTPLEILAYTSFGLAAVSLAYSVYTIVIYAPGLKDRVYNLLMSNRLSRTVMENWGFRTILTSTFALAMSIFNSVLNAYLGISERSIWFGALAAYYIFLALMRSGLLIYHRTKKDYESEGITRAKRYMLCGILLLILYAALSSAIAQMIFDDRGFSYKDWLIFAFAAYAFYKIIMAVRNAIKARRQDDLTIQAIREINLVDAAVSILALQTALLHTFGDGSVDISLFNTLTGSVVSIFSVGLSIMMIVRGHKKIKELKNNGK
ncbi:MAG: hypothetical protein IKB84_00820 [Clostridia bacterium]|nr:hypothetical protein [Clostridia bacterium]